MAEPRLGVELGAREEMPNKPKNRGAKKKPAPLTIADLVELERVVNLRELRAACADWLRSYEWDHIATFTARDATASELVAELNRMRRELDRVSQRLVCYWYSVEYSSDDTAHLHALLYGTAGIRPARIEKSWHLGFAKVEKFHPEENGIAYLLKRIVPGGEWGFGPTLPPKRTSADE